MSEKNVTPIYTTEDLARLVANHDREHPEHGHDCGCENGLLPMLRTYFDPPASPMADTFPPYVPPDLEKAEPQPQPHARQGRKPWLQQREDETEEQYNHRTSHSCYNCGAFIVDTQLLDLHEDECSRQGKRDDRWWP